MTLTKFGHSCVRVDDGDRSVVFDPGAFSDSAAALDGVDAILITHEHFDHVDVDAITAALQADSRRRLFAPSSVAGQFAGFGEQVGAVAPGDEFEAGGFAVTAEGGQHAVIHPLVPVIANVAYRLHTGSDGVVGHPGDSFTVPAEPVDVLLAPVNAPWSKLSEVLDYLITVRAKRALPIHDALVNDSYDMVLRRNAEAVAGRYGVSLDRWD